MKLGRFLSSSFILFFLIFHLTPCVEIWKETGRNALQPAFVNTGPLGVALLQWQWGCYTTVQAHYLSRKASNELGEKCPFGKGSIDIDGFVGKLLVMLCSGGPKKGRQS